MVWLGKFIFVDLNDYYCNKGISFKRNNSDFTGMGSSYLGEQLPESNSPVLVHGTPFTFPDKESVNNLDFNNQEISVPCYKYSSLHILGSAENGTFKEEIKLVGEKGEYKVKLGLTDWINPDPVFGEKIAFRCQGLHSNTNGYINSLQPTIWYQVIDITSVEPIYSLILGDNPGLRIFALTCERE